MNMNQYKDYHYSDTDKLNFENDKRKKEAEVAAEQKAAQEQLLKERLEKGEISQAEYDTLSPTTDAAAQAAFNPGLESLRAPVEEEDDLIQELTDEDQKYLRLK